MDSNFIVASGCQDHNCSGHYAMFILDIANKLAWAIEGSDEGGNRHSSQSAYLGCFDAERHGADTRNQGVVGSTKNVPEGRVTFVPLSEAMSRLYNQPRRIVVKAETTPPTVPSPKADKADIPAQPLTPQAYNTQNSTIPLGEEVVIFLVSVVINGELTLKFTIDSGASDVSIPADVVLTLLRTGTLTKDDFVGTQSYRLADGSTSAISDFSHTIIESRRSCPRKCHGKCCSCCRNLITRPEFLRFRSWSIDNQRQVLLFSN